MFTLDNDDFWQALIDPHSTEHRSSIATWSEQDTHPLWEEFIDVLRDLLSRAVNDDFDFQMDFPPDKLAITSAIRCLQALSQQFPAAPPTFVGADSAGGIVIERRVTASDGIERISEFTLYNDGSSERALYRNGKVVEFGRTPAFNRMTNSISSLG